MGARIVQLKGSEGETHQIAYSSINSVTNLTQHWNRSWWVRVLRARPRSDRLFRKAAAPPSVETDSAGRFSFRNVPPGRYAISVRREGYFGPFQSAGGDRRVDAWYSPKTTTWDFCLLTKIANTPTSVVKTSPVQFENSVTAVLTTRLPSRTLFETACRMDLEGIVTKRKDSVYRASEKPSPHWI